MKKVLSIFLALVLGLGLYLRNMYATQDMIILRNTPLAQNFQFVSNGPFEEVFITAPDGHVINGLLFASKTPPKGVLLYLHGRGYNLGEFWGSRVQDYTNYGYDVLSIDYRGFGKSTGGTTEETLLEDAELAYAFLLNRYQENDIIVYGQSLGTGFATYVASKHEPKMLILEAPYYSLLDMAKVTKPYLPEALLGALLKYHLRSDLWIPEVECPIHFFHGTRDRIIPYSSGKKLYSLVEDRDNTSFYTIENWGHDGIMYHKDYITQMDQILETSRHVYQVSH